jgi:molybdate transport system substrate-binding protein
MRKVLIAIVAMLLVSACSSTASSEVLVSAAASLTDAFSEIETEFERANPSIDVVLNFGGSSALREQILAGAPADVFASANQANMQRIAGEGFVTEAPIDFAINRLEIAVPAGNPASVTSITDLAKADLLIGLCAATVPCGDFARDALAAASVVPAVDTDEPDVRALLTKIEAGELDAGIVYATDVAARADTIVGVTR